MFLECLFEQNQIGKYKHSEAGGPVGVQPQFQRVAEVSNEALATGLQRLSAMVSVILLSSTFFEINPLLFENSQVQFNQPIWNRGVWNSIN